MLRFEDESFAPTGYSKLYYEAVHNVLGNPGNIERANYVIGVRHQDALQGNHGRA